MTKSEPFPVLTKFGGQVLDRIDRAKGHKLVIFDSFFNAIKYRDGSKVSDDHVERSLDLLDHWCRELNATIFSPFHTSRTGAREGHFGYSPLFENHPRQLFTIQPLVEGRGAKAHTVPDRYVFSIEKWNNGPRREVELTWEDGCLFDRGRRVQEVPPG